MQLGPDVLGGIRIALALIPCDQRPARDHTGDTGQADPLP